MTNAPVVTRFAPSPTGTLHIGGARTALFNWLYARGRGGKFLLRIEDTDLERSTPEATKAILDGMAWLGLDHDGEPVSQAAGAERHRAVALDLLAQGKAYKCFSAQEEIAEFRDNARENGTSTLFNSPWRDVDASDHPDLPFVVRMKAPRDGVTVIKDQVQGDVTISNVQLDDMILLRSDGSPVYMLAVVVDDHDMGVTHVIRGDDHLNNAARQMLIYSGMGWDLPIYAHIPLILGPDGKKMSKRHGATGVMEYAELGYPAVAMRNYLARLGWSHGDDEFFNDDQAKDWFDLDGINKSAARFDFKRLDHLTGQHMKVMSDAAIMDALMAFLDASGDTQLNQEELSVIEQSLFCTKDRAKNVPHLIDLTRFVLCGRPLIYDEKLQKNINSVSNCILNELTLVLGDVSWSRDALETAIGQVAEANEMKLGKLLGPLRAAISGQPASPSVFDMMLVLGRDETCARLDDLK